MNDVEVHVAHIAQWVDPITPIMPVVATQCAISPVSISFVTIDYDLVSMAYQGLRQAPNIEGISSPPHSVAID